LLESDSPKVKNVIKDLPELTPDIKINNKARSQSSSCITRNPRSQLLNRIKDKLVEQVEVIKEEEDPEEKKRRKEQKERFEKQQIDLLEKLKKKKEDELNQKLEEDARKLRIREKLLMQVVGDMKKRTLEDICKP